MRWKINKPKKSKTILIAEKGPNIGDKKEIVKFAFIPKKIDSHNVVWLEKYIEVYEYRVFYRSLDIGAHMVDYPNNNPRKIIDWQLRERKFFV